MNPINPRKLLHSKWTAVRPLDKQKHFVITEVEYDEEGNVEHCVIEAIINHKTTCIDWRELKDTRSWRQGWK